MRLEDLDDAEKARLSRAIEGLRADVAPVGEAIDNDWYCEHPGAWHDFIVSAQKSADITLRSQLIHKHSFLDSCDDQEHLTVGPDLRRARAVGGPQHARTQ
jgi:hypothetical protein